jgi:hypothetical protein
MNWNRTDTKFLCFITICLWLLAAIVWHKYCKASTCEARGGVYIEDYCLDVREVK